MVQVRVVQGGDLFMTVDLNGRRVGDAYASESKCREAHNLMDFKAMGRQGIHSAAKDLAEVRMRHRDNTNGAGTMISMLGALRHVNPREWERRIRVAMRAAAGRIPAAAEQLGVSKRQLFRWLGLPQFADLERVEHGLPMDGVRRGRPKKAGSSVRAGPGIASTRRTKKTPRSGS
jgi:hypothetical protein